ncbi:unnamed protein product [Musa acuminata var. zebrina]
MGIFGRLEIGVVCLISQVFLELMFDVYRLKLPKGEGTVGAAGPPPLPSSSWLVYNTTEPFESARIALSRFIWTFLMRISWNTSKNYLTLWSFPQSTGLYILCGTIVGGQLWWPKAAEKMQINNIDAFGISTETCRTAIASHPNFSTETCRMWAGKYNRSRLKEVEISTFLRTIIHNE